MKLTKAFSLILLGIFTFSCQTEEIEEPSQVVKSSDQSLKKSSLVFDSYLVISTSNDLPTNLEDDLNSVKGKIKTRISEIGIAVVESEDPNFVAKASKIKGVQYVVPNITLNWYNPLEVVAFEGEEYSNPPFSGDDDKLFDLQWGHDAVDAVEAWNAGYRGAGVRVGVIDGGFDTDHPDLAPNVNMQLSRDFSGEGLEYAINNSFSHGSHTAGTIGAADNGLGTIGIAPEVELVLLKALADNGNGNSGAVINAIVYAAVKGVDVVNMSIGSTLSKRGGVYTSTGEYLGNAGAQNVAAYIAAYNRATNFAYQMGTTIIASAGNAGTDMDHSEDLIHLPSGLSNVITISATAPRGWATNPTTANLDYLASYSNYGQSEIDFAAPGGDYSYPIKNENCSIMGIGRPCYIFDYVFSTGSNGSYFWSVGTSMAAPHATGVAAIIIGKNGGDMKPAQVLAALRASADDLGKPGRDDAYGYGRVNAYNAVKN